MSEIFIDPELESYLNALSEREDEEFAKDLIAAGGPDEPIKVWKDNGAIVDGHRRYKVCMKHNLPFKVKELKFDDMNAVKRWMCRRQRFRRNLSDLQLAMVDARLYQLELEEGKSRPMARVAEETGKSIGTISRNVTATEVLERLPPKAQKKISTGEVQASVSALVDLAHLPKEEVKKVARKISDGTAKTVADAVKAVAGNLIPKAKPKVARADAAMPESYVDDVGTEVPKELWDVWRARGEFYQVANDLMVLKGRVEVLAKTVKCESTENVAKELEQLREHVLGLMPARVKGKHWINAAFVKGDK